MKRIICLLLTLCLLAACALAGAEDALSLGKPYDNPNLYTVFPAERPGPEENYYLYANYDLYADAYNGINPWYSDFRGRANQYMSQRIMEICRNQEYNDPDSEIIRILYNLASDTEKLERDGLAPLMTRVDRVKAVRTLDELTALIEEDGFLLSAPFIVLTTGMAESNPELYTVKMTKTELQFYVTLPHNQTEEEMQEDEAAAAAVNNMMRKRQRVEDLLTSKGMDPEELKQANLEMAQAEREMNANEKVMQLKAARKEFSAMMDNVNRVLRLIITGEIREDDFSGGCSGSCDGCSGCG